MTEQISNPTWGWETLVEDAQSVRNIKRLTEIEGGQDKYWDRVDDWWRALDSECPDQLEAMRALLEKLREIVPKVKVKNGMEYEEHYFEASKSDGKVWQDDPYLTGAARILEFGELEATVEGYPPPASEIWDDHLVEVGNLLDELTQEAEISGDVGRLSRLEHADQARDLLKQIKISSKWAASQMDSDHDRNWFDEVTSGIAYLSFEAGRRTHAAWGKEFEQTAAKRLEVVRKFSQTNEGRTEINLERKAAAKMWQEHAKLIIGQFQKEPANKSECATWILAQWNKLNVEILPTTPKKRTIQNWLSKLK